ERGAGTATDFLQERVQIFARRTGVRRDGAALFFAVLIQLQRRRVVLEFGHAAIAPDGDAPVQRETVTMRVGRGVRNIAEYSRAVFQREYQLGSVAEMRYFGQTRVPVARGVDG